MMSVVQKEKGSLLLFPNGTGCIWMFRIGIHMGIFIYRSINGDYPADPYQLARPTKTRIQIYNEAERRMLQPSFQRLDTWR